MGTTFSPGFFCDSRTARNWLLNGCPPLHRGLCLDEINLNEVKRKVAEGPFKNHVVEICAVEVHNGYVWAAFWADKEITRSGTFKFATAGLHAGLRKPFRATV